MRRVAALAIAGTALACALAVAGASSPPPAAPHLSLFVSADMRGYLGPCGCSENMRGGIARAAEQVQAARKEGQPVFFVDAGDSLFGKIKLNAATLPQEKRKAKALADAFRVMGLSAKAVGEKDDEAGANVRKALELPTLAAGEAKLLDAGLAVVAANDAASLKAGAKKAQEAGAKFVVALFHGTQEQAQAAAKGLEGQLQLVVASHAKTELDGEDNRFIRGEVPIATVQSKGRSLLRLDVYTAHDGAYDLLTTQADVERELKAMDERIALLNRQINQPGLEGEAKAMRQQKLAELITRREQLETQQAPKPDGKNAYAVRFIPLEATLPGAAEAKAVVDAYDRDVGRMNLEWAKQHGKDCPAPKKGQAGFIGSEACRECHEETFPVWEKSKHSHAYETLATQGKQYHLDCIGCHVTGFQKPGGVCRVDKVKGRDAVGCESCHGPGSIHADDPTDRNILKGNTEQTCVVCHDPENSPHFEFTTYLRQVLGAGHGAKAR